MGGKEEILKGVEMEYMQTERETEREGGGVWERAIEELKRNREKEPNCIS